MKAVNAERSVNYSDVSVNSNAGCSWAAAGVRGLPLKYKQVLAVWREWINF